MAHDKQNIENKAVVTGDIHELVKREVDCQNKAFMIAQFAGEERMCKNQREIMKTLKTVAPSRTLVIVDNVITKTAIIVLFFMILMGCTASNVLY